MCNEVNYFGVGNRPQLYFEFNFLHIFFQVLFLSSSNKVHAQNMEVVEQNSNNLKQVTACGMPT